MARPRNPLDPLHQGAQVLALHPREKVGWRRERLLAVKLGLEGKLSSKAIAAQLGHSQTTITSWFNLYRKKGIEGLLEQKQRGQGFAPELDESQMQELAVELEKGRWRTAKEAYAWLKERFNVKFGLPQTYRYLKKLGGRLKVTRPCHTKKDPLKVVAFKETLAQKLMDLDLPRDRSLRLWIYDEARYGLAPVTRRMWTRRGTEVVCPVNKQYQWGYVFGALQIGGAGCEFLFSPKVSKEADRNFLEQISRRDPGAMHVIIGDGAGFHHREKGPQEGVPKNVRILTLPPYSPELNPVEKLWDLMKDSLCNRVYETLEEVEKDITRVLKGYWEDGRKVFSLIGKGYLLSKLNAI
ncbi:IS630 family transposase [Prosthecobacter dejongeii]|uniref:Transposase n=1 Tax=Prosthecobacter dejongeii TaxID=48465 RepID=A0A7W8DNJ2_9BACT|nr:IS630 family transposase [Prosthecobacter dejongeii]MBB5036438.1 transposase [Prosthecobacter dejongeii]